MKRFGYIPILGFILLIALPSCAPPRKPLESNTVNARQLFQQGKTDSALIAAQKAIDEDPDNAGEAWYQLAKIYDAQGNKEEARKAYSRVLESANGFFTESVSTYHLWANYDLGASYYWERDYDKAIEFLNKALEIAPADTNVLNYRGWVYLRKGLYKEAIGDFNIMLSGKKQHAAYRGKAYSYLGLGDTTRAFSLLKQSSEKFSTIYDEALFYYALGEEKKLKDIIDRTGFLGIQVIKHKGKDSKQLKVVEVGKVSKGSAAEQAGMFQGDLILSVDGKPVQGVQGVLRTLQSIPPGKSVILQVRRKGEEKQITAILGTRTDLTEEALSHNLYLAVMLAKEKVINKAMLAEQNGELRSAFFIYSNYLRNGPKRPIEYEQDVIERIIKLYRRLDPPPAIPEEAHRHAEKAAFYLKDAKTDEDFLQANVEFEQAARIAPWWADIYFNYALAQQNAGDNKGAINNLKLFLLAAPNDPAAREVHNRIYTLEAEVEKYAGVKRWEGRWKYGDNILKLTTKGDAATMVYIKVSKASATKGYRPSDTKLSGSISNDKIKGERIGKRLDDADVTRCFGKEFKDDMIGQLSSDGQTINIQYKSESFTRSTCEITQIKEYTDEFTRIP